MPLALMLPCAAQTGVEKDRTPQERDAARLIDVPALPSAVALRRLGEQTGFQLLYPSDLLQGATSPAVRGVMTARAALRQLLRGTGISIVDTGPNAAVLRRPANLEAPAGLEDREPMSVLVTARKFSETVFEVPAAVSVLNGASLRHRGDDSVASALREAPGVSIHEGGGGITGISIRGITTTLGGNANGFYLDDLPFTGVTVPISPDVRAWDLQRVEVLRGPQGTLFGEGSMGGTVRILTNNARLDRLELAGQAGASTTAGGEPGHAAKLMANIPVLPNRLALRFAGTSECEGGWIDAASGEPRDLNRASIDTARMRLHFRASDALEINTTYWMYRSQTPLINTATDDGVAARGLALSGASRYTLGGLSARYDLGPVNLFYSHAGSRFVLPRTGILEHATADTRIGIDVKAHELRLASAATAPWRWTAGMYWRLADRRDMVRFESAGLDQTSHTRSRALSVFGDLSYRFPALSLEAGIGLRHFRDRLLTEDVNEGRAEPAISSTFGSNSPRFSLGWRPDADSQFYGTAAKGFRSGQNQVSGNRALAAANGIALPAALRPDAIWTHELGAKMRSSDGRSAFELAVYRSRWKDVAVRVPLGATGFNGLLGSEGTRTVGLDGSLTHTMGAFAGTLTGAYVRARFAGGVPGTGIVDGAPVDDIPRLTLGYSGEYRRPMAQRWQLRARAAVRYSAAHPVSVRAFDAAGDAILDADARVSVAREGWTWSVYASNLFDDRGATTHRIATVSDVNGTELSAPRLRPRTVGVQMTIAFGE